MKVAFTSSGDSIDALFDSRFGRAKSFIVYDLNSEKFEVINNEKNLNAVQGAGVQAAETIIRAGAKALVTGHCGPKAFRVLEKAGIKIYNTNSTTVKEALDDYKSGQLAEAKSENVEGHW